MLKVFSLAIVVIFLTCLLIQKVKATDTDIISFPYEKNPCTGKLLGAVCCQGIKVNPIDFDKTVCIDFQLKLLPPSALIKIRLDKNIIAEFTIDPKKPPTYCIPVVLPVNVAMCIRLHDVKFVGVAIQICSTIYVNYESGKIFEHALPCVKLTTNGIEMAR